MKNMIKIGQNFEVSEEDTGCRTKELKAYMGDAYLLVEIPRLNETSIPTYINGQDLGSPQHIVGINLAINYGPGTDISRRTAMSRLKKQKSRLEGALQIGGLGVEKFNEEEPGIGDDFGFVEHVYSISCDKDPAKLQTILDRISSVTDELGQKSSSYMGSQLEEMFVGKLDEKTLAGLVKNVDAEIKKVTTDTGSIGVVKFKSDGNVGYGKVSVDKNGLQNEHNALRVIQDDGLARILAPRPIGLALGESAGALFTWGTENKGVYNPKDVENYFNLYNTLLFTYAQKNKLNLRNLAKDQVMQDVFNRAIIHSSQIVFDSVNERPSVIPLEQLEERAGKDNAALQKLREYSIVYEEAVKRLSGLDSGKPVFIHGDSTPENIGRDPFSIRPLIDWANARMGCGVQDLSTLGAKDTSKYADWYNFVMEIRGGKPLTIEGRDAIVCYDVLQPFRTGSFKIAKGRTGEAEKDIAKLGIRARAYSERFGTGKR